MKKKLFIIGAGSVGGHIALNINDYSEEYIVEGFFDDDPDKIETEQFGYSVLGPVEDALDLEGGGLVIGIAFPKIKKRVVELLLKNRSLTYPCLIHNQAWVSKDVSIGDGTIVYPGTSINYGSEIGNFVTINMNCALGHHTRIGNYSNLAPGVNTGGHTSVEEVADIGIGASTVQDVVIGSNAIIGGQAMVTTDIPPDTTAVGVPARVINEQ